MEYQKKSKDQKKDRAETLYTVLVAIELIPLPTYISEEQQSDLCGPVETGRIERGCNGPLCLEKLARRFD